MSTSLKQPFFGREQKTENTSVKCKVNWEAMCRPIHSYGGQDYCRDPCHPRQTTHACSRLAHKAPSSRQEASMTTSCLCGTSPGDAISRTPSLLFKLDIRKAFDSVKWKYMLDLLQRRAFPSIFRDWITALLLNGIADMPIAHGRGLRMGTRCPLCSLP